MSAPSVARAADTALHLADPPVGPGGCRVRGPPGANPGIHSPAQTEAEQEPMTPGNRDSWEQAAAAASAAYRHAPGSHAIRLHAALEAHLAALATAGLLVTLPPGITGPPTTEEDALWLAVAGGHPRHAGDGWRRLLDSEVDVLMAFRHATKDLTASQGTERDAALARRNRLLARLYRQAGDSGHDQ